MPPIPRAAFGLAQQAFDSLIHVNGVRLMWRKAHTCPCTNSSSGTGASGPGVPGSGKPSCLTCYGLGIYWDAPVGPFMAGFSFMGLVRAPDEPGAKVDEVYGTALNSSPSITIAQSLSPEVWVEASVDDQFIEVDAPTRFNAVLTQGYLNVVPFFDALTIEPTGAVTTWNSTSKTAVPVTGYTVTENEVQTTLPLGTPFTVEFRATSVYIALRKPGGQAHVRPMGYEQDQHLPRRFQAQQLDRWIRARAQTPDAAPPAQESNAVFPVITAAGAI